MRDYSVTLKALAILTLAVLGLANWTSMFAQSSDSTTVTSLSPATSSSDDSKLPRLGHVTARSAGGLPERDTVQRARVVEDYARLPLSFEANQGQTDPKVKFLSRGSEYALFLTATESVLVLNGRTSKNPAAVRPNRSMAKRKRAVLRMKLEGANSLPVVEGLDERQGKTNYYLGSNASKWRTTIANYGRVQYRDVYPGVDLIYHGSQQRIEFDFVVAGGADIRKIKLEINGAKKMRLDVSGDLVLTTSVGEVRQHKPFVYQEVDGARREISSRYVLCGRRQIGFEVGEYDASKPLVIDPVLDYSTYLGGTDQDEGRSIVLDSGGNAYITGRTTSFNFPVTIDGFDTTYANSFDVFVTKLNAAGSDLVYSTYVGGNSDDSGLGIVVDSAGNAYVAGSTSSSDYPTTAGAFDSTLGGGCCPADGFVTKLNSSGTALVYSTYLGGSSSDQVAAIAVDSSGNAYVTGSTQSTNFPTSPGAFQTTNQGGSFPGDAFITKLNGAGTALVYSTFLGGTRAEQGAGIVVDSLGRAFIAGSTNSTDFDFTAGAFQTTFGGSTSTFNSIGDAFVTELNDTGTALAYSTYVGGTGDDAGLGIALNSAGEAFICGTSASFNYPVTPGVVRVANGGAAKSTNSAASWAAINAGLTDSTVLSFAINPLAPATVYAGTDAGGVFKSTNGGVGWNPSSSGLTNFTIKALAIDPATPSIIYLGTNGRGVFKSTDSGSSWRGINTGQGGDSVNALVMDPSNPSIVYAGTDFGVFKTTNSGASWSGINTGLNNTFVHTLAIDPVNPATLYAGTFGGVFITRNGGQNWTAASLNSGTIRTLQIDPLAHTNVYAGGDSGISKSTDEGASWRGVNSGLTNRIVNSLAISSGIYAGTGNGVFKSTNGGGAWSPANTGLAGSVISVLAIDPTTPATVYAGMAFGSQDGFITKLNSAGAALVYSTYLGGNNSDTSNSIALDIADNAYVTGQTGSPNFPTTAGTFQALAGGFNIDAYVAKLNSTGAGLAYSTFLGGSNTDLGSGITVNSSGEAYVTGTTTSSNFPTTPDGFQVLLGGVVNNFSNDAFVAKLNQTPSLMADLKLEMTGPSGTVTPGNFLSYNITLINNGPDPAFSIVITNELPASTTFNGCNSNSGSCFGSGSTVTFNVNSLASGASVTLSVFATVNCAVADGATLTNTATVESPTPDPNAANNIATVSNTASNPGSTILPTSQAFAVGGGSGFVNVTTSGSCSWTAVSNASWITITFSSDCCNGFVTYTVAANSGSPRIGTMTIAGRTFTVTQSGGGSDTIGLFRPTNNLFFLRNSNTPGFPDITAAFGATADLPIVGDWDGNDTVTIGLYRQSTSTFFLRNSNTPGFPDVTVSFGDGPGGDLPVVGDWDGDGIWTIGVYRPGTSTFYLRNTNTAGFPDLSIPYGAPGDMPIVGDWDGNGTMTVGLFRASGNIFFLRNSNTAGFPDITVPFGAPGDLPLAGDWDGDGTMTIGLFRPTGNLFFLRNSNTAGFPDTTVSFGADGDKPLAGNWDGL